MVVLDATIVNIALPSMADYFNSSQTNMTWALNAYTLAFGGLLLLGGRAGDILGRRRMFIIGLGLFTLGSLLGGVATSFGFLLFGRVVQGIGGAIASPTALSLVTTSFEEGAQRTRAFAVYAAVSGAGAALGLLLGGMLTEYLSLAVGAVRQRADRHRAGVGVVRLPARVRALPGPIRLPRRRAVGARHGRHRLRLHQRRQPRLGANRRRWSR